MEWHSTRPQTPTSRGLRYTAVDGKILSYSNIFKDHLAHPHNGGELAHANAVAEQTNPVCGDRIRLSLRISNNRIEAAQFLAYGCPPTLVCGSAITEMIQGLPVEEAAEFTPQDLINTIGGLPSRKRHAAALAIDTLLQALQNCLDSA